jgi:putative salt-induced outer membrane protein YdiY
MLSLMFLMSSLAWADDEVKLKNGDRLSGKIITLAGGKLTLETTHSGPLKIDWSQVVSVKTDAPLKVTLTTGEVLEGKVVPGADGRLKVETTGPAAPVEMDLAKVKFFNEPPTQWHGSINAAGKVTEGNTQTKAFLISAEGTRETEQDLILARAIFHYGQQGGVLTERNSYGIGKYQYKFLPRFYGYVSEELLSDTFKDIDLESITSVGAGYDILKESWINFSAEAGIAYFSNNFKIAADESHLGARAATKLRIALPLGFEFKDLFIIYPNFKDSQNFQLRNEATLGTALGGGWNLLGGVITEYNNKPAPGIKDTDDTYWIGLGYTF